MSRRRSATAAAVAGAAPVFAALGDETRLRLVARLSAGGPSTIVALTEAVPVTRQAVTKHLHALVAAGVVRTRTPADRRQRVWELEPRRLAEARAFLERISEQWDGALERLKAFVEE